MYAKPQQSCKSPQKVKLLTLKDPKTGQQQNLMMSVDPIGQGKYAKVHKAFNINNSSKVYAVKIIKVTTPQIRQIQKLPTKCRNILYIHKQYLESENNFYIFQQYCQGGNLFQFFANRQQFMDQNQIFDMFYQLYNGFIEIHKAGISHEDIKPNNILLKYKTLQNISNLIDNCNLKSSASKSILMKQYKNTYKFCDFGVSQIKSQAKQSKIRKGTISYMPPQKLTKINFLPNAKSDIYSLGVTIFQVIFKKHPYLAARVSDYKSYLSKLNSAKLKSLKQLLPPKQYDLMSFKFLRLYDLISRMIELNQSKRITLQQLTQYINNSQPFKSMVQRDKQEGSDYFGIQTLTQQQQQKRRLLQQYQIINSSVIQSRNGYSPIQVYDKTFLWDDGRVMAFYKNLLIKFRQIFVYFNQGLYALKLSNQYQINQNIECDFGFKKIYIQPNQRENKNIFKIIQQLLGNQLTDELKISSLKRVELYEILIVSLKKVLFNKLLSIFDPQFKKNKAKSRQQEMLQLQCLFVQAQCESYIKKSTIENIERIVHIFTIETINIPELLNKIGQTIFDEIVSIRVNFNEQILSYFFLKYSHYAIKYLQNAISVIFSEKKIQSVEQYQVKMLIQNESQLQQLKKFDELYRQSRGGFQLKQQIKKKFDKDLKIGDKKILIDLEENTSQFQILDPQAQIFKNLQIIQN